MNLKRTVISVLVIISAIAAVSAQDKAQKIDSMLRSYFDYGQLNGSVLVAENGTVIYKKGFGMANMEWEIPNQPNTKFRIGSVTKQFTAALIMQLVERGKVKLDGRLTEYLPDYRKDTGDKITIHQLLNHTSGIPSYTGLPTFGSESKNSYKVKDFVKKFASGDLEFEPGTKFKYNNSGYYLLGAIIEQQYNKPYAKVLQERIFDPLGMKDSGYDESATLINHRASGYERASGGYRNAEYLDMSLPYSAGSLYSTVEDLFKWETALHDNKVVSAESRKLMFTPGLSNYGYGFGIHDASVGKPVQKIKVIQHGGGINGFNSLLTRAADQKHTVVILDNVGLGRYHDAITYSIFAILNGQEFDGPKRSIAEVIGKTAAEKGGVSAAIAEYRRLKTGPDAAKYDFAEGELNTLGYEYLRNGQTKDAIEIFKLNVEMFPDAFNPYDSLGEAYLKDGQKELALKNYRRSVELNPNNLGGVRAIQQIEGKEVKVDTAALDRFLGEYELAPGFVFVVTREGNKLMGQATGQPRIELNPVSEFQYSVAAVGAEFTFEKGSDGKITGLVLNQGGQTINAKKIK